MSAYAHALLTDEELAELSGHQQAMRQIKWLRAQGIGYALRGDGKPRTTWGAVDHALIGELARSEPNFDAI